VAKELEYKQGRPKSKIRGEIELRTPIADTEKAAGIVEKIWLNSALEPGKREADTEKERELKISWSKE